MVGATFALAATAGDFRYTESRNNFSDGLYTSAFLEAIRAESIFPLKHYTRENIATMFYVADTLPATLILEHIDRILKGDPNSPYLLWYKAMQHLRNGDVKSALPVIEKLERVGKGWKQTENARAVYLAVETHVNRIRAEREYDE